MRRRVEVGQVWRTMANGHAILHVTIEAISPDTVSVKTGRGRRFQIRRKHFEIGLRGTRLLRHADGSPGDPPPPVVLPKIHADERRMASDLVKTTAPRGLARASDVDRETLRLFEEEGVSGAELAKKYKVSRGTIHCRISRAREAMADDRNARALERQRA
jgi:DNA-directed RNA polymerase specialized sigma24 family protein